LHVQCRPEEETKEKPQSELLDVADTDDEFIIKKPANVDPKYQDFLDELYRHDDVKNSEKKTKRETETIPVDDPKEYIIPEKPVNGDENYDKFISELYSHDDAKKLREPKLTRQKRMLIFRHED
jgi:hypothetical protein